MSELPPDTLEELGRRLEAQGFRARNRPYFAATGLGGFTALKRDAATGISWFERSVFLYPSGAGWEARVTQHGGPDWTRKARTLAELEVIALEVLRGTCVPPSPPWRSGET